MDRDIPIPPARNRGRYRPGTLLARVRDIPEGLSDFIPASTAAPGSVSASASLIGKELGCTFVTRTLTEHGVRGVRGWRKGEETT